MQNKIYQEFYYDNFHLVNIHIFLTLIILPLELVVFSVFTKLIFDQLHNKNFTLFFKVLTVFIICLFIIQLIYSSKEYVESMIIPKFETKSRNDIIKEILSQPNHDYSTLAEQFSNIQKIPNTMYRYYENFLNFIFPFVVGLLIFSIYLFWVYIPFGILGILFFSLYLSLFYFWFLRLSQISDNRRQYENILYQKYEDILNNHENIVISNTILYEWELIRKYNLELETTKNSEIYYSNLFKFIFSFLLCLFFLLLFLILFYRYRLNTTLIPLWKIISFLTILILFCKTCLSLLHYAPKCIYHSGSYQNITDYFKNMPPIHPSTNPSIKNTFSSYDVHFNHVWFKYSQKSSWVLKDFNLYIPFKTRMLISGHIGSGKSTLGKLLIGLIYPTKGSITINSIDIHKFSQIPVSYMNQNNILFDRTIKENILYGCANKKEAEKILDSFVSKFYFLKDLMMSVGRSGSNLSGGQRRIIFLLRCFFQDKPIVIVDEPTANIDLENIDFVIELLNLLSSFKTLICISHDPILESHFPIHIRINNGTIQ